MTTPTASTEQGTLDATEIEQGMPKVLLSMDYDRRDKLTRFLRSVINPTFSPSMTRQNLMDNMEKQRIHNLDHGPVSLFTNYPTDTEMSFLLDWFVIEYRDHHNLDENNPVFKS